MAQAMPFVTACGEHPAITSARRGIVRESVATVRQGGAVGFSRMNEPTADLKDESAVATIGTPRGGRHRVAQGLLFGPAAFLFHVEMPQR